MFNAVTYFEELGKKLKLTKDIYHFCRVTGLNYLEDILTNLNKNAYLAVDDSDDGVTIRKGGAYFNRRAIVVYILKRYKISDQLDRETKLNETRVIRDKFQARLIKDSNEIEELFFLDKTRIPYKEFPGYFASGVCGCYFIITIEEPKELTINASDWTD
jgi:hypothetical protein